MPRGIPLRTGIPSTSSAISAIPGRIVEPPVMTMPEARISSIPHFCSSCWTSMKISSTRGSTISARMWRERTRGWPPPTLGTSMVSDLSTIEPIAQPCCFLIRSASCVGVRSPTATSFVRWLPPSEMTAVCWMEPLWNTAMSVVPPPMSTRQTPSSFSSSESVASDDASGCSTMSATLRPVRCAHFTMFCAEETAPVTMRAFASRRTPLIPTGSFTPSWSSTTYSCGRTWITSPVERDRDRLRLVDDAVDVLLPDLLVLHRDDAVRRERLDVAAGDAGVDGADLAARHVLGLLDRALDRGDGGVDVDDHALAQALRRVRADADDVDAVVGHLADDGADLRRADVEADEDVPGFRHEPPPGELARRASPTYGPLGPPPPPSRRADHRPRRERNPPP